MSEIFEGVIPVMPTPFSSDGDIDFPSYLNAVETAIRFGVHGIVMFGLASEYYKLTDLEREQLRDVLIQQVSGRVPVIISVTSHATRLAVMDAIHAAQAGADAIMVLPPFFLSPALEAIQHHILSIAHAVSVPIIVQYAPLQTSRFIDAEIFAALCREAPNIECVKVDMVPAGPIVAALRSLNVPSLVGYLGLELPEDFSQGAQGVMPTLSLCPMLLEIWRNLSMDLAGARAMHESLLPLLRQMMQSVETLIASEKSLLVDQGILKTGHCRMPTYELSVSERSKLKSQATRLEK